MIPPKSLVQVPMWYHSAATPHLIQNFQLMPKRVVPAPPETEYPILAFLRAPA